MSGGDGRTCMFSLNSSSAKDSAASTSSEEDVTPPLLADASLKTIAPLPSRNRRAGWVMNRFAPSTMYWKRGLPSSPMSLCTLLLLTASGRPPHGTNSGAEEYGSRWNWLRKSMQRSISVPSTGHGAATGETTRPQAWAARYRAG